MKQSDRDEARRVRADERENSERNGRASPDSRRRKDPSRRRCASSCRRDSFEGNLVDRSRQPRRTSSGSSRDCSSSRRGVDLKEEACLE